MKAMPWVAERGIVVLPDNVSFEEATFIEPINTIVKAVQKARVVAGRDCAYHRVRPYRTATTDGYPDSGRAHLYQ